MECYDVAIIGLGAMGSAAAAHCAMRGARTIAFEQFELTHERGSSAGHTRIIRKAYFEDVAYVPLLERAYTLWRELEVATRQRLLDLCGVLVIDREDGATARGVLRAASLHEIPVQTFTANEARRHYPQFILDDGEIAVLEPEAGIVFPELGIVAHLELARRHGATLLANAPAARWERAGDLQRIVLRDGRTFEAKRIIVTAGAWLPTLFARMGVALTVQRNVQYWFDPRGPRFTPGDFPAFFLERAGLPAPLYGMPDLGLGVKVALHGHGETTAAGVLDRTVREREAHEMRALLEGTVPGAAGELRGAKVCMYTLTADAHFALGRDPDDAHVIIGGGFSGHGYKFAPVIGEVLAQLTFDGGTPFDIGFLDLRRLLPK